MRVLKNSLVTRFISPFSYENLSGQGTFSTLSTMRGLKNSVEIRDQASERGKMGVERA
jgi:hypothetical protein